MFPSKFLQFPSILTHFHAANEKIQNGGRDLAISRGLVWVKIPVRLWPGGTAARLQKYSSNMNMICDMESAFFLMIQKNPGKLKEPGPWFNIKTVPYQYRNSRCADKMILRPCYLHNGISYPGMTTVYIESGPRAISLVTPIPELNCGSPMQFLYHVEPGWVDLKYHKLLLTFVSCLLDLFGTWNSPFEAGMR